MPETAASVAGGVARNSSWLMAKNAVTAVIIIMQGLIMARFLGAGGYGLYGLITAYVAVVNQVVDFRIYEFATKYIAEFWGNDKKGECLAVVKAAYLLDISTGILAFFLVLATAGFSASYILSNPAQAGLIVLYSLSLLFSTANGTAAAILGVFGKFPWLTLQSVLYVSARFMLVLAALAAGKELPGVIAACVAADLLGGLLINYLALRVVREKLGGVRGEARLSGLRDRFGEMARFLAYTNLNEFMALFTKNIDILFLGYFRNSAEAGLYKLAKNFAGVPGLISEPVYAAVFPAISGMTARGEYARVVSLARRLSLMGAAVFLPLCAAIIFAGPFLIEYTAGAAYAAAAPALNIMVWGAAVGGIFAWVRPALLAMGRADFAAKINLLSAVLLVLCSLALVPRYGYIGSAVISLLPWVFGHAAALIFLGRNFVPAGQGGRK